MATPDGKKPKEEEEELHVGQVRVLCKLIFRLTETLPIDTGLLSFHDLDTLVFFRRCVSDVGSRDPIHGIQAIDQGSPRAHSCYCHGLAFHRMRRV